MLTSVISGLCARIKYIVYIHSDQSFMRYRGSTNSAYDMSDAAHTLCKVL